MEEWSSKAVDYAAQRGAVHRRRPELGRIYGARRTDPEAELWGGAFRLGAGLLLPNASALVRGEMNEAMKRSRRRSAALVTATPELRGLVQAHSLRIEDDWTGYSPVAPIEAHCHLERATDGFKGKAHLSVAGHSDHSRQANEDVSVPADVIDKFLRVLAETPVQKGEYCPTCMHTDDYPNLVIEVGMEGKNAVFSSSSQGQGHAPWQVTVGEDLYVSPSTVPAKALEILRPYLKREVLEVMIRRVR